MREETCSIVSCDIKILCWMAYICLGLSCNIIFVGCIFITGLYIFKFNVYSILSNHKLCCSIFRNASGLAWKISIFKFQQIILLHFSCGLRAHNVANCWKFLERVCEVVFPVLRCILPLRILLWFRGYGQSGDRDEEIVLSVR